MSSNDNPIPSPRSSNVALPTRPSASKSRSPPPRNTSLHLGHIPSPASQNRQSFSESLRGLPPSPRAQRQPSMSQIAIQDLIDNPPARNDPTFGGRDWRSVTVEELVSPSDVRFVESDTAVEAATNVTTNSSFYSLPRLLLLTRLTA